MGEEFSKTFMHQKFKIQKTFNIIFHQSNIPTEEILASTT